MHTETYAHVHFQLPAQAHAQLISQWQKLISLLAIIFSPETSARKKLRTQSPGSAKPPAERL